MQEDDVYLRQRIRDILQAQIRAQNDGGVLLGSGYISPQKARQRALKGVATKRKRNELVSESIKGWKTRRMDMKGRGYGTSMGAIKAAKTRKRNMMGKGYGTRKGALDNPWLAYVKSVWRQNPGILYKEALQIASQSYNGSGVAVGGRKKVYRKKKLGKGIRKVKKVRKIKANGYYLY